MIDVLSPESAMVARLIERLPPEVPALTSIDLDGVLEQAQGLPAVHVLYGGLQPLDTLPDATLVRVTWTAVVCVRNANTYDGIAARREAGPLIATVLRALQGLDIGPDWSPLDLADGASPLYADGAAYFPISFTTDGAVSA